MIGSPHGKQKRTIEESELDSLMDEGSTSAAQKEQVRGGHEGEEDKEMRQKIIDSMPSSMPIINKQFSLKPDMMFG